LPNSEIPYILIVIIINLKNQEAEDPMRDLRMTRQRQTILDELKGSHSHPPADEIYESVRRHLPHISLGTVYRNLEILCEHGLVQKLEHAGFQRRYDARLENHYHVRCVKCGNIKDIEAATLADIEDKIGEKTDYVLLGHHIEFVGLCPGCVRKKQEKPN
jgi:Fur family ferric uptake transcriptional regulator